MSIQEALAKARPGDTLQVSPGEYRVDSVVVTGLSIIGSGEADKVVIWGQIEVRGTCRISHVTLRATHFHNAVKLATHGARLEVDDSVVCGEATSTYPAVFAAGGVIVMKSTVVHHAASAVGVYLEGKAQLHARASALAHLHVRASHAALHDVKALVVRCVHGGQVEARGSLDLFPPEGTRSLLVEGESAFSAELLRAFQGPWEGLCAGGYMRLDRVEIPPGETYLVLTEGRGRVDTNSPAVTVRAKGAPPVERPVAEPEPKPVPSPKPDPEPVEPPAPKVVLWRAADASDFRGAVAPLIAKGDTVLLEEGDYFLDQYDGLLAIGVDLAGKGRAEKTVVHGGLAVLEGCDVSVANISLRPRADANALVLRKDRTVSLTNVVFESAVDASVPAVYVGGTATLTGCRVVSSPSSRWGAVDVDAGGHLEATDSELGWLRVWDDSSVRLAGCRSVQVWADDGSRVTAVDGHTFDPNDCGQRQVVAQARADVRLTTVSVESETFEAFVESSSLTIDRLDAPEGVATAVYLGADAEVDVQGRDVVLVDRTRAHAEEEPDGEPASEGSSGASSDLPAPKVGGALADDDGFADDGSADEDDADPLAQIMSLVGLARVKEQVQSFVQMVQFDQRRRERGLKNRDMTMHSMFLGNPGTGKTTVARLLGEALHRAGATRTGVFVEVGRRDLVAEHVGASALKTQKVLESARGGVLFVDEAYALHQEGNNAFGQEAVDTILAFMENNRDDIVVLFAGYTDRMRDLLSMNAGLASRIPNRFDFEDYLPDEIADIGYRELLQTDYQVDESVYRRAVVTRYTQSADTSNGRWVRNFNEDLVKQMVQRVFRTHADGPDDLSRIADEDVYSLVGRPEQSRDDVATLLDQLDALVGLDPVKAWVRRLVNRVRVDQQRSELGGAVSRPTYHMVFSGNPGTGKTTVAKILARLFFSLGILESPTVKVVDRSSLVGSWIGHTEKKTTQAIDESMGGVLFVDEAYQLSVEGAQNDFGKQALETMMTRLEDDRSRFVAIFAGYTDSMEHFLGANPGLRSRIPLTIEFPDYSPAEVAQIVVSQLAASWDFDEATVIDAVERSYAVLEPQARSNGRWARNLAECIEAEQIEHLAAHGIVGDQMRQIPDEVIAAATAVSS